MATVRLTPRDLENIQELLRDFDPEQDVILRSYQDRLSKDAWSELVTYARGELVAEYVTKSIAEAATDAVLTTLDIESCDRDELVYWSAWTMLGVYVDAMPYPAALRGDGIPESLSDEIAKSLEIFAKAAANPSWYSDTSGVSNA